eukprot:1972184-Ditylum_brightwellii.AAC.1
MSDAYVKAHYVALRTTNRLTGVANSKDDVYHEPPNLLSHYPTIHPLDFSAENNDSKFGVFITISGAPEQRTATLHQSLEIKKWRGSSTTEDTPEGVEGDEDCIVHDSQPVKGSEIIQE